MKRALLVRGARQLLTLRGLSFPRRGEKAQDLGVISDGAILILDGVIHSVGPSRRIENLSLARGAEEIPAHGCVVMPGFVDPAVNLAVASGWEETGRSHRTAAEVVRKFLRKATAAGTTSLGFWLPHDASLNPQRLLRQVAESGSMTHTTLVLTAPNGNAAVGLVDSLRKPMLVGDGDPAGVAVGAASWTGAAGRDFVARFDTAIRYPEGSDSPLHWLPYEPTALTLRRPLSPNELAVWASGRTVALIDPVSQFESGRDLRFVRQALDEGVPVAMTTGYDPNTSPSYSLPFAIALAARVGGMTPEEAIAAATINAAFAAGTAAQTGSLEPGKRANLAILTTPDYRELANLLGVNLIGATMIRGVFAPTAPEVPWQASLSNASRMSLRAATN